MWVRTGAALSRTRDSSRIAAGLSQPEPPPGDLVGVFNAGAYGRSMSLLEFMSRGRPAELVADCGRITIAGSGA